MRLRRRRGGRRDGRDPAQRAKDALKQNKKSKKAKKKTNQIRETITRQVMKERAAKNKAKTGKPASGQLQILARKPEALKKKPSASKSGVIEYEDYPDECSICRGGGTLLLCDGCPKAFHLGCVELSTVPKGDWFCAECEEKRAAKRKAKGKAVNVSKLSPREQRRVKREKLQHQQSQALEKKEKPSKKPPSVPLVRKKRRAAQGPKHYADDGRLALADDRGHRDFSGHFFKFRDPGTGITVDGIVIEMNEDKEYVVDVKLSNDSRVPLAERFLRRQMRPSELSERVVPFEKLCGRTVIRILSGGRAKMGFIKKYLGPRTRLETRKDPQTNQQITEDVTEHIYRIIYPGYDYEDPETGVMLAEKQAEEHLNSLQVVQWLQGEERKKRRHLYPFKQGDDIPCGYGVDRMRITLIHHHEGRMNRFFLTVPMDCSVAQLMQIIWQQSEWDSGYSPEWQKLEYFDEKEEACHWINEPGIAFGTPLADWGITHASNVQFSFRREPLNIIGGVADDANDDADWVPEEKKRKVIEEALSNQQLALIEKKDTANLTKPRKNRKRGGPSLADPREGQKYNHWSVEEVTRLVNIVGEAYSKQWHLQNKFWERVSKEMGKSRWNKQDVRTKWRGMRYMSGKQQEDRRGLSKEIPEEVYEKVRLIVRTLEKPARRGMERRKTHEK